MKKILLLLSLILSVPAYSEIGLKFNMHGEFIPPDMILQARGLKAYEKGFFESSKINFKKSAKFGNDRSKYLMALLSFQDKDWANGYAWLKLIKGSMDNKNSLMNKVEAMLTENELADSLTIFKDLKKEYNDNSSLRRRNKWERSLQGVGTHISGIDAMTLRNVSMNTGDNSQPVTGYQLQKQLETYIYEYQPKGVVEMGVIKEIENKK
jgi:hypothetical protein